MVGWFNSFRLFLENAASDAAAAVTAVYDALEQLLIRAYERLHSELTSNTYSFLLIIAGVAFLLALAGAVQ